jgi:hypothetical protein
MVTRANLSSSGISDELYKIASHKKYSNVAFQVEFQIKQCSNIAFQVEFQIKQYRNVAFHKQSKLGVLLAQCFKTSFQSKRRK